MAGALPFPAPQVLLGRPDRDRRHIFREQRVRLTLQRTHLGDDPHPPPPTPQRHLGVEARKLRHQLEWTPGERLPGVLFFRLPLLQHRIRF
jgi:hypothetical protein